MRQDVKVFPIFRVCLWLVESTKTVCNKVYGEETETQVGSGKWERYLEMCYVHLHFE